MPQLFSRAANSWMRFALAAIVACAVLVVTVLLAVARSPDITGENKIIQQPVPFSHQHHVADAGIDCRYCHASVESSAFAGIPSTQLCMNRHRYLWTDAAALVPVRASLRSGLPLVWNRVHDLPDHVFFNHAIHIHKGIGCYSCHGRVHEMPLTRQDASLTMQWCLDCHREPQQHLRPRALVYETLPLEELTHTEQYAAAVHELMQMTEPRSTGADETEIGVLAAAGAALDAAEIPLESVRAAVARQYNVRQQTDCYTCHR